MGRGAHSEGRFLPGTLVLDRYRILDLLGRGGMGEVYRADDMKLGQPVALKFLPESLAADPASLTRLHDEVRLARQVSHPNVCRVHDIGEVEGTAFVCMEYVDGEDLSSLLRRIGRLPGDKALQIARQLCAGLGAAHAKDVLHRDLKPSNIMIDGRGNARLTDFGLAAPGGSAGDSGEIQGTPAYMAPEQMEGGAASVQSDLYSLGLVLYELFTGRQVYQGSSWAELMRVRKGSNPPTPRSLVADLEPAVERAILRCLDRDPRHRPASALAVAAMLPGVDPLAAALAAGETPSPALVAAAGEEGSLRPSLAAALLFVCLAGLVLQVFWSSKIRLVESVKLPRPPVVLADRAATLLASLGYEERPGWMGYGFEYTGGFALGPEWARRVPIVFWYRQAPFPLLPQRSIMDFDVARVSASDPPLVEPGMVRIRLDPEGKLLELLAVPPREGGGEAPSPSGGPSGATHGSASPGASGRTAGGGHDWSPLLREAGLEPATLASVEPRSTPPVFCDSRAAFEGSEGGRAEALRVEAGALDRQPVWFQVSETNSRERPSRGLPELALTIHSLIYLVTMLGGLLVAFRNDRLGRTDRPGAFRLGLVMFGALIGGWALAADHSLSLPTEVHELARLAVARSLFWAGSLWVLYLALEPYVRRRWPERIIAWSRLLAGRWRDPLVGRDVLIGTVAGIASVPVLGALHVWARTALGLPATFTLPPGPLEPLLGVRFVGWAVCGALAQGLFSALAFLVFPLLLQVLLRKLWLAVGAACLAWVAFLFFLHGDGTAEWFAYMVLWVSLFLGVTIRFGLLAGAAAFFCHHAMRFLPFTADLRSWYAGASLFSLLLLAGLVVLAFTVSLGRRPFLRDEVWGG